MKQPRKPTKQNNCVRIYPEIKQKIIDKFGSVQKFLELMIKKNIRVNNEFYVCPVFNEAIEDGKKIRIKDIDKDGMWGIGTPEDLNYFLEHYKGEV